MCVCVLMSSLGTFNKLVLFMGLGCNQPWLGRISDGSLIYQEARGLVTENIQTRGKQS